MTTTTEVAPTAPLTEAEAHDALVSARAEQAANTTDIETLRSLAETGRFVDAQTFAKLKVGEELNALRVAHAQANHEDATERANHCRREAWADSVRPTIEALDADAATAAGRFNDSARALVAAIKARENAIDALSAEAHGVGESERVEISQYTGCKVDGYSLTHYKGRILSETAPAFCAILTSAGEPGQADIHRIAHKGAGLPRPKESQ
jgi:hypothetical protein